jgi:hypothetical protein
MLCRVALVRTEVSEELRASIIMVTTICELGTILVTLMMEALSSSETSVLTRATEIGSRNRKEVRLKAFIGVMKKNAVFWDVALSERSHDVPEEPVASTFWVESTANVISSSLITSTLEMEATRSSETSVLTRPTQRHTYRTALFRKGNVYGEQSAADA